jgi:hypothetical protein
MAAITAALIGAAATAGTAAYTVHQQSQAGKTTDPVIRQGPQDPLSEAMRGYYARTALANADKTYPSFGAFLQSGGDPSLSEFNMDMPALKPSEAAAFGFTGPRGEVIPGVSQEDLASGRQKELSPEQILYLAKERRRKAVTRGQPVGPWAQGVIKTDNRLRDTQQRLDYLHGAEGLGPRGERRVARLEAKEEKLAGRQQRQLNPAGNNR